MSKSQPSTAPTCNECGQPVDPHNHNTTLLIGFGPGDTRQYLHVGQCEQTAGARRADTKICRGCGVSFPMRPGPGKAGRPAEFHDEPCRRRAAAGAKALWQQAAKGDIPTELDAITRRRNACIGLLHDIRDGRQHLAKVPRTAKRLLEQYHDRLLTAEGEAVKALQADRQRRAGDRRREWAENQKQAAEAELGQFLGELT